MRDEPSAAVAATRFKRINEASHFCKLPGFSGVMRLLAPIAPATRSDYVTSKLMSGELRDRYAQDCDQQQQERGRFGDCGRPTSHARNERRRIG